MNKLKLISPYKPVADQPKAIKELTEGIFADKKYQTLLGVTGSGKTFTMANVIEKVNKPTLVISHNKTLAAQLYSEFKEFFPENSVEYFVSYYDYYQPEAYIPQTDTYIEKDASINDELDRLRLSSTSSLMSRNDVIIVASVSCIYNLGSPGDYRELLVFLEKGQRIDRDEILRVLVDVQYTRDELEFVRGKINVKGDTVEVFPSYAKSAYRIELFGDTIEKLTEIHPVSKETITELDRVAIYPAKHFVTTEDRIEKAIVTIEKELEERLAELKLKGKTLQAQRLLSRTKYDMEMLREFGYCHGVENYSRHLSGRPPGSRPYCLIDYFLYPVRNGVSRCDISNPTRIDHPKHLKDGSNGARDFLIIIDESHVTIPQIGGMYNGDRSRKETLVEYGFRLPSCLDNRPLRFEEFEGLINQVIFVSATPAQYELSKSKTAVEQIIRPTGLVDPQIKVLQTKNQIDDLMKRIKEKAEKNQRTLVSTLTKRMAEELAHFLSEKSLRVKYFHSEFDAFERVKILKELRLGEFDCLVGVNLLREGLDLPEVSLVAILDADKEGFLRSQTSLIQVAGRAARNVDGEIVMYADTKTRSMENTLKECQRRRKLQLGYNKTHNITPTTIKKAIRDGIEILYKAKEIVRESTSLSEDNFDLEDVLFELEHTMQLYARNLQFEEAARTRDEIKKLLESRGLLEKKNNIKLDATKELLEVIKTRKKGKKYAQHSNRG